MPSWGGVGGAELGGSGVTCEAGDAGLHPNGPDSRAHERVRDEGAACSFVTAGGAGGEGERDG